jgi:hypothetical protein
VSIPPPAAADCSVDQSTVLEPPVDGLVVAAVDAPDVELEQAASVSAAEPARTTTASRRDWIPRTYFSVCSDG